MTISVFIFVVLPAGTVVVAGSTTVATTSAVPFSDDRHLHGPEPHFRLPPPSD